MNSPKVQLPASFEDLCEEIGHRLFESSLAAMPDAVRDLLPAKTIGKRAALATANEWRDKCNLPLHRLAQLCHEAIQQSQTGNQNAIDVFRSLYDGSSHEDVRQFVCERECPQEYLAELIARSANNTDEFMKLLELLVKLGKG